MLVVVIEEDPNSSASTRNNFTSWEKRTIAFGRHACVTESYPTDLGLRIKINTSTSTRLAAVLDRLASCEEEPEDLSKKKKKPEDCGEIPK